MRKERSRALGFWWGVGLGAVVASASCGVLLMVHTSIPNPAQVKEYATPTIAVGALVVALTQFYLNRKVSALAVYARISDRMFDINDTFVKRPDLRAYFYHSKRLARLSSEELTHRCDPDPKKTCKECQKVDHFHETWTVGENIVDFFSTLLEQRKLIDKYGTCGISWLEWEIYIRDMFWKSPVLLDIMLHDPKWYERDLLLKSPASTTAVINALKEHSHIDGATDRQKAAEAIETILGRERGTIEYDDGFVGTVGSFCELAREWKQVSGQKLLPGLAAVREDS